MGRMHDCVEGRADCAIGDHDWIDVTALGDGQRRLLCGRAGCGAEKREAFEAPLYE